MNKLRVLSILRPLKGDEDIGRRVKTVDNVPNMLTIISDLPSARRKSKLPKDQEGIQEEDEGE